MDLCLRVFYRPKIALNYDSVLDHAQTLRLLP